MIDYKSQLKLQAYHDGELSARAARRVEAWLATDPDATALLAELRHTRAALAGHERDVRHPESREFFWSKIEREIRQREPEPDVEPLPLFAWWRKYFIPVGATAALVFALVLASKQLGFLPSSSEKHAAFRPVETTLADAGALTYRDHAAGVTLVWLSYPAEKGFTDGVPADTLQ